MLIVYLLRLVAFLTVVGGGALVGRQLYLAKRYRDPRPLNPRRLAVGAAVVVGGLLFSVWSFAATYVPATQRAVVENTTSGSFKVIGPGIHMFPFQSNLVPLASKVTKYSLRAQQIEIGTEEGSPGIAAGSDSPGNPAVYIQARGWATPTNEGLIALHRKYGPDYLDTWVERNWVTAVKTVQGNHPYDFLVKSRQSMADEIEAVLQAQLFEADTPLVNVSQLAITNFDFPPEINNLLKEVAQKEFERQKAFEDAEIARQRQVAQNIEADTRIQIAKKDGEATVAAAAAEAEAIRIKYENDQRAASYLQKLWIDKWNGVLPTVQAGGASMPILNIPPITAPAPK